jgi:2-isopropylmalate synthase
VKEFDEKELIYDWNVAGTEPTRPGPFDLNDETLRDGLQSPSVTDPEVEDKIRFVHLMDRLGIHAADIGLPGAGPRAVEHVYRIAKEIVDSKLNVSPNCAARTVRSDVEPIIDISQRVGIPIEACTFIGSSPIRAYAEEWTLDQMLRMSEDAVTYAVTNGLPVMFVTEDTTRADPETLRRLYTTAIECGARRVCVSDTVGHATPDGVKALLGLIKEVVKATGEDVKIDWHGHRDRGLSVPNALSAIEAGADRVHATALGIGERVGNTPMDLLIVNLRLLGWLDEDPIGLQEYCEFAAHLCRMPIPKNWPVVGDDAFRTATGVHADAVIKAEKKGHHWLADRIYSAVPASIVGREQQIEIGPMSGESNVRFWLEKRGIEVSDELVGKIFDAAKRSKSLMTDEEVMHVVKETRKER